MHAFANPLRFQRITDAVFPYAAWSTLLLTPVALVWALFVAPADYQQGEAYRIIYVHVPAAYMATFTYAAVAAGSFVAIVWRHPLAEIAARAAAPVGAVFTAIALFTGSVWGKPMWGTWWVWDARLTSVLILFFLYLGYILLHDAFDDPVRGARAASILALVGAVNLPIIK
ncbi:MAG: cytochrome c biogenesis protein CcsA, partial [Geminicoccaceae bacterium]|nr:cytochrome c biogenesis protein CcsA [Geminicoccaceae bacterium]